jgi:hypothetical protein
MHAIVLGLIKSNIQFIQIYATGRKMFGINSRKGYPLR